jgi:hypothetical protein
MMSRHLVIVVRSGIDKSKEHILGKATITSIKKQQQKQRRKWGCSHQRMMAIVATAAVRVMEMVGVAVVAAADCSGGQGIGQCKQLRRRQKFTIKYQKAKKWHKVKDKILAAVVSRGRQRNGNGYGVCQVNGGGRWAW